MSATGEWRIWATLYS